MSQLKTIPIEGLIPGGNRYNEFQPKKLKQLQAENGVVSYVFNGKLHLCKVEDGELKTIGSHLVDDIKALVGESYKEETALHPIKGEDGCFWLKIKEEIVITDLINLEVKSRITLKKEWEAFDYNSQVKQFAYTEGNGLFLLDLKGNSQKVYQSSNKDITAGQTAARDEFGNEKGTFWSNDGKHLAFFITDQSHVTQYPLVDVEAPIATLRNIYYPMAGKDSEQTTIGIYDIENKKVTIVDKQGGKEDYLCCVTFSPDDNHLLAAELTRDQQHCQLNLFETTTGKFVKTILKEEDDKYTEPEHAPLFVDDNDLFIWQSRKSGYNAPYLCSLSKGQIKQLVNTDAEATKVVGYDNATQTLVFESNTGAPYATHLYGINLEGRISELSATDKATHKATLIGGGFYIEETESATLPYRACLRQIGEGKSLLLVESESPLKGYEVPQVEIGTTHINGYDICYRLIKPTGYDPHKKYPMVCYFYGGPHVQLIHNDWNQGTAGFEYMMAQQGYFVFTIDPRGSANRGLKFEQEVWRNIGGPQIEDYEQAVKWICNREKTIDSNRIGVYGWSFGGFMSTSLMLKKPDLFKVGVAGGPVTNWRLYEVMYTERYMQTPQVNKEGYDQHDLTNFVKNLKGKLMLIHCNTDPVVLWQNSLEILHQSVKDDKQIDYNVYVGHPHNVRGPERVHLMKKVRDYFVKNL